MRRILCALALTLLAAGSPGCDDDASSGRPTTDPGGASAGPDAADPGPSPAPDPGPAPADEGAAAGDPGPAGTPDTGPAGGGDPGPPPEDAPTTAEDAAADTGGGPPDPGTPDTGAEPDPGPPAEDAAGDTDQPTGPTSTEPELKVAFIGDQGLGLGAAVLGLVKQEDADLVIHSGDFDYADNPSAWKTQMDIGLGPDFPYFASVGNHDVDEWPAYQQIMLDRLESTPGAECTGTYGEMSSCTYRGLHFLLVSPGLIGDGHEAYIREQLADDGHIWSVCSWHVNQRDMQTGTKSNQAGWGVYQACQDGGAIIATGHEHAYSRTHTLTALGNRDLAHGAIGEPDLMEVGFGQTFVFVSGLGGKTAREFADDLHEDATWWATIYTSDRHLKNGREQPQLFADVGALFITFNVDGDPRKARGYFKTTLGSVIDEFEIRFDE